MSNVLAGGFDDVPTTAGDPPRVVAPPVTPPEQPAGGRLRQSTRCVRNPCAVP
ncbi:hypothetical protein AB1K54_10440 [Microbacterium sp. BWT-B31]|uniref:hypothetical protein n=1 Tax=Microbacterium sp. BWT-B31 TaxID=3232072 RepID=UPI003529C243